MIRHAKKIANRLGVLWERNHKGPGAATGFPDFKFYVPGGRPLIAEFKKPGEGPTKKQAFLLKKMRRLGYDAGCYDNSEAFGEALAAACAKGRSAGVS